MADFAPWYRREDYDRIREIMDDGAKLPSTFDEWESRAKSQMAQAEASGIHIKPIIVNPDDFMAFCREKGIPRGSKERGLFAVTKGSAEKLNSITLHHTLPSRHGGGPIALPLSVPVHSPPAEAIPRPRF